MNIFTFFFKDGKKVVLRGLSAANALISSNIPRDNLSFYEKGNCEDYTWSEQHNKWACSNGLQQ